MSLDACLKHGHSCYFSYDLSSCPEKDATTSSKPRKENAPLEITIYTPTGITEKQRKATKLCLLYQKGTSAGALSDVTIPITKVLGRESYYTFCIFEYDIPNNMDDADYNWCDNKVSVKYGMDHIGQLTFVGIDNTETKTFYVDGNLTMLSFSFFFFYS